MKQVTLNIPDSKFDFIMKLFNELGIKAENNINIPQWQMDETAKRLKLLDENPDSAIDFDQAMDDLEKKYDL